MQDTQSTGGGGGIGMLFGGGERRLKAHHQETLKCPRCDSLNTKFCYYNNYNLSQPRFYCKGCRRYWTNGGVLRNVPVGGGCRKIKRSKKCSGNANPSTGVVASICSGRARDSNKDLHKSGNESSFVTTPFTLTEVLPTLFDCKESRMTLSTPNQSYDPSMLDNCSTDNHHMLSQIATFESLITSSSDQVSEITSYMQQEDDTSKGECLESSNRGVVADEWSLFDESYLWNNTAYDHQLNYFLS